MKRPPQIHLGDPGSAVSCHCMTQPKTSAFSPKRTNDGCLKLQFELVILGLLLHSNV